MVSRPPCERAREAAVRSPARLRVRLTPRADWRGVEGLWGETALMKGRRAFRAV